MNRTAFLSVVCLAGLAVAEPSALDSRVAQVDQAVNNGKVDQAMTVAKSLGDDVAASKVSRGWGYARLAELQRLQGKDEFALAAWRALEKIQPDPSEDQSPWIVGKLQYAAIKIDHGGKNEVVPMLENIVSSLKDDRASYRNWARVLLIRIKVENQEWSKVNEATSALLTDNAYGMVLPEQMSWAHAFIGNLNDSSAKNSTNLKDLVSAKKYRERAIKAYSDAIDVAGPMNDGKMSAAKHLVEDICTVFPNEDSPDEALVRREVAKAFMQEVPAKLAPTWDKQKSELLQRVIKKAQEVHKDPWEVVAWDRIIMGDVAKWVDPSSSDDALPHVQIIVNLRSATNNDWKVMLSWFRFLGSANQQLSDNDAMIWYDSRRGRFQCSLQQGCLW